MPEIFDSIDIDERRLGKKLSIIEAEEEDYIENQQNDENSKPSPKSNSNLSCGGLGFSSTFVFDELSPIREMIESNSNNRLVSEDLSNLYDNTSELMDESVEFVEEECPPTKRRPTERQRAVSSSDEEERRGLLLNRRRRYTSSRNNLKHVDSIENATNLARTPSEPTTINQLSKLSMRRAAKPPMLRR